MIKFSVIIVSYINVEILENCINSIYKFNDIGDSLEIIIVDNSPGTILYDYIKSKYSQIEIIKSENNGFGSGNNIGVKKSSGEHLLFLNPDTILIEPIFKFAIDKFEKNPNIGMFGLKLLDENRDRNLSYYFMDNHGLLLGVILKFFNKINFFIPKKMFVSGANMFMRKKDFLDIGMFDKNFFMYFEEKDLTKRLLSINKTNAFFKKKSIIHLEGKTTKISNNSISYYIESMYIYCNKYSLDFNSTIKKRLTDLKFKRRIYNIFQKNTEAINNEILITQKVSNKLLEVQS